MILERASKQQLLEVLAPFEQEVRGALRNWAEATIDRSGNVDRTAAQVVKRAVDLLDELETENGGQ